MSLFPEPDDLPEQAARLTPWRLRDLQEPRDEGGGVKTGTPIWKAMKVCPDGLYVKRDFRWYEVLSRLRLAVVREFSPKVEYYSIDEFFFDATPPRGLDCLQCALKIRDTMLKRVGVPVTMGIARTRTQAKLISDGVRGSKRGRITLNPDSLCVFVGRVWVSQSLPRSRSRSACEPRHAHPPSICRKPCIGRSLCPKIFLSSRPSHFQTTRRKSHGIANDTRYALGVLTFHRSDLAPMTL